MIPFAPFAPDRSRLDPTVSDRIVNVLPKASSYGPFPALVTFTGVLPSQPRGAVMVKDSTGTLQTFAATLSGLYRLNTVTLEWDDVTNAGGAYATSAEEYWSFTLFGDDLIASNYTNNVQKFNLLGASPFVDLGGTPPKALHTAVIGDFVFLFNTSDGVRETRWSGLNDAEWWSVRQRSSDVQPFPDGGRGMGVVGFERGGVFFQEDCIREGQLALDTPLIFTFQKTVSDHGCVAPKSIVNAGAGGIFYLSQNGFYRYGQPPTPIGNEAVDQFFTSTLRQGALYDVQGAVDPVRKVVYWRWASSAHVSETTTDKVLAYHYTLDRWTLLEVELSWLTSAASPGYTLDSIASLGYTLDTLPFSLDSRFWQGGAPTLAAFDASFRLGTFAGLPLEATLQTADVELNPGRRALVTGFRPITDAQTVLGRVASRDTHMGARSWGEATGLNRIGLIQTRKNGRLHRFEVTVPSGESWEHFHGVEDPQVADGGGQ